MLRYALSAVLLLSSPAMAIALSDASAAPQQDPQAAYQKLAKSFAKAMSDWQDELQAKIKEAQKAGERPPRSAYRQPTKEFVGTAQELAQEYAETESAVMFLGFILKNASNERNAIKWAVKTLARDHADGKAIGDVVDYLPKVSRAAGRSAVSLLNDVADNHSDSMVRCKALLARSRQFASRDNSDGAIADLEQVQLLTKDADLLDEVKRRVLLEEVKESLIEIKKLAIGSVAPEIDGVDINGVKFKLSDYRGKAVLLDFWGFW